VAAICVLIAIWPVDALFGFDPRVPNEKRSLIYAAIVPFVFVVVGSRIAPKQRIVVAIVLACLILVLLGSGLNITVLLLALPSAAFGVLVSYRMNKRKSLPRT
jgi:hypothetical protein